jgi:anti-sigma factor RsiW
MTACPDKEMLLQALLDGELDAANALAAEAHLKTCPGCAAAFGRLQALRRLVRAPGVRMQAPEGLKTRIEAALDAEPRPQAAPAPAPPDRRPRRLAAAAPWALAGAMAALAASLAVMLAAPGGEIAELQRQVVFGHVRAMQTGHELDLESADRRAVGPWLKARLGFEAPTPDLTAQGYELAGARVDWLHQRRAAALVYRRGRRLIDLYVWPSRPGERLSGHGREDGYSIGWWTAGGLEFWAVSDLAPEELARFRAAVEGAAA